MKPEEIKQKATQYADEYYEQGSEMVSSIDEATEWSNRHHNFHEGAKWMQSELQYTIDQQNAEIEGFREHIKETFNYKESECESLKIKISELEGLLSRDVLSNIDALESQLTEANHWGEKLNSVARNVLKEATKVYCHYNEIIKNKNESMDFKTLKELNAALSEYESTKVK